MAYLRMKKFNNKNNNIGVLPSSRGNENIIKSPYAVYNRVSQEERSAMLTAQIAFYERELIWKR